jgi:hypothetical protein
MKRVRIALGDYDITLRPGESLIGRSRSCHLRVDDPTVSRRHARMLLVRDVCTIADLGSRNGVKVNAAKIADAHPLVDGDVVTVGALVFTVRIDAEEPEDGDEIDPITQIPGDNEYQVPIYRTCIHCRGMLKRGDQRCPHCGAEQASNFKTIPLWADPHGRRRAFRAPVRMRALYVSASMTLEGEVSDISLGGAFFGSQLLDDIGTACDLLLFPTDDSEVVRFAAEVVRVSSGDGRTLGVGLRFLRMSSAAQAWLLTVVTPPATE